MCSRSIRVSVIPRAKAIHANIVAAVIERERFFVRIKSDRPFGGDIDGRAGLTDHAADGAGVEDDAAAYAPAYVGRRV